MENPINMDDLGGFTPIFGNTHLEGLYIHLLTSYYKYHGYPSRKKRDQPTIFLPSEGQMREAISIYRYVVLYLERLSA